MDGEPREVWLILAGPSAGEFLPKVFLCPLPPAIPMTVYPIFPKTLLDELHCFRYSCILSKIRSQS